MEISYSIEEEDFLRYQLFSASRSERIIKKRRRNRFLLPVIYVAFALWFFISIKISLAVFFLLMGLLWFFAYPKYESRKYINHFKGYIKENLSDSMGHNVTIVFGEDSIHASEEGSEATVKTSEIAEINETADLLMIRFKSSQSWVIPKRKIPALPALVTTLKSIASRNSIPYNELLNWAWK